MFLSILIVHSYYIPVQDKSASKAVFGFVKGSERGIYEKTMKFFINLCLMMTPEQEARLEIDNLLIQAGWIIQDMRELDIFA